MQPLVSIVVPTYNQARYLPACLDAAMFQDYPEIEVVVVNDASSDDTGAVLAAYRRAVEEDTASFAADLDAATGEVRRAVHPRYPQAGRSLTILTHEENRGLGAALNTGFRAARGELVTYIASDDWLLPGMVRELAAALTSGADFAYADMHVVNDAGRILRRFSLPEYSFEAAFCHWYLCGVCKLYRRTLHEANGFYREDLLAHDHELYLRFAMAGARFAHVPQVLACVRHHGAERAVDNHAPANWRRLMAESAELVRLAREFREKMEERCES